MNLSEIKREVEYNIKDARADILISIPDYINEAYLWATSETNIPQMKNLFLVDTVINQPYTIFPSTFDGRLTYVGNSTLGKLNILQSGLEGLVSLYPDMSSIGEVMDVALEGNTLWYQPIPDSITSLICVGYRFPVLLINDVDIPVDLPLYLHRSILVNKASEIAYSKIEDGLETEKPNTLYYAALVQEGMIKLHTWLVKRLQNMSSSVWDT